MRHITRNTAAVMPAVMAAVILCLAAASPSLAGWADKLSDVKETIGSVQSSESSAPATLGSGLSTSEIVSGLKAALERAVDTSVSSLGATDGFLGNPEVKIPVPESFSKVESALRLMGQSELADEFVTSMNRAAEKAVPETVDILGDAITNMSFADAEGILNGGDTAATDYFRTNSDTALFERIEPIVSQTMSSVGVTDDFKNMLAAAKATGFSDFDLDGYVTREALDGLYLFMEKEEASIRSDPAARVSDILKKVFGSE